MTYVRRVLENNLSDYLKTSKAPYNCVLLMGARQCGKSTLLQRLFPKPAHMHINLAEEAGFCRELDLSIHFEDFISLLEKYFNFHSHPDRVLIIDEAQLSKRLGHYVRFFVTGQRVFKK